MLSDIELRVIKEKNNEEKLIYINFKELDFVFKVISISEYTNITSVLANEKDIEDAVCQCCLIYPDTDEYNISLCPYAGVIETAYNIIIEESGINNPNKIMDMFDVYRKQMESFDMQCKNMIKAAFYNEFSYEEMDSWSWYKLLNYAIRAETILSYRRSEELKLVDTRKDEDGNIIPIENVEPTEEEYKEYLKELRENGIDPMLYFHNDENKNGNPIVDVPFLGGVHWQRSDVIDAIREQMERSK